MEMKAPDVLAVLGGAHHSLRGQVTLAGLGDLYRAWLTSPLDAEVKVSLAGQSGGVWHGPTASLQRVSLALVL